MMKKLVALVMALGLLMTALPAMATTTAAAPAITLKPYSHDDGYTYVEYGYYPYETNGALAPILWRVVNVAGESVTLVSEYAIDAYRGNRYHSVNHVTERFNAKKNLSTHESNNMLSAGIMSNADVKNADFGYTDHLSRRVKATPYAALRNLPTEDGYVAYWVRNNGLLGYVTARGDVMKVSHAMTLGVVPMVTVGMQELMLDGGSGTMDDPYFSSANAHNIWLEENLMFTFGSKEDKVRRLASGTVQIYTGPGNQYYAFDDSFLKRGAQVTILARTGSWLLIEYQTGKSRNFEFATGYIPIRSMYNADVKFDETPSMPFCSVDATIKRDCDLYDDRYMVSQPIYRLWSGNTVTLLGIVYYNGRCMAYVEADMYDQTARGFVDFYDLSLDDYDNWTPHYSKGI